MITTMANKGRKYDHEYKGQAVKPAQETGSTVRVASELGISKISPNPISGVDLVERSSLSCHTKDHLFCQSVVLVPRSQIKELLLCEADVSLIQSI